MMVDAPQGGEGQLSVGRRHAKGKSVASFGRQMTSHESFKRTAAFWAYLLCILCLVVNLSNLALLETLTRQEEKLTNFLRKGTPLRKQPGEDAITTPNQQPASSEAAVVPFAEDASTTTVYTEDELAAMNCSSMPWYKYSGNDKAMWIPGYPGSGSDMLRTLVTALTGLGGHGVYADEECFHNHTATCKTHWPKFPTIYPPDEYKSVTSKRVVVLIRNPKDAMPSYFNYLWEIRHRFMDHTIQAPEDEWNSWRDEESPKELNEYWYGLIQRWKETTDYEIAFYLPFERLTHIETGPQLLMKLAAELRSNGVRVANETDIPCLWYKIVKGGRSKTKRAAHKYVPSYTSDQRDELVHALEQMQEEFADDAELVDILSVYLEDIRNNIRVYDP